MAFIPRDFDAEERSLRDRVRKNRVAKVTQFGQLVQETGADAMPIDVLAGALIAAAEQFEKQPEALARWAQRGRAFLDEQKKLGRKTRAGNPAPAAPGDHGHAQPAHRTGS